MPNPVMRRFLNEIGGDPFCSLRVFEKGRENAAPVIVGLERDGIAFQVEHEFGERELANHEAPEGRLRFAQLFFGQPSRGRAEARRGLERA